MNDRFDPFRVLRELLAHDVHFVVIGGMAARAWGSPSITNDLDICYERTAANHKGLPTRCASCRLVRSVSQAQSQSGDCGHRTPYCPRRR